MKFSFLAVVLSAVIGLSLGFGVASLVLVSTNPATTAVGLPAAEPAPIEAALIVAVDAPDKEDAEDGKKAKDARKTNGGAPPQKPAARRTSAAAVVKELEKISKAPANRENKQKESDLLDEWIELDPVGAATYAANLFAAGGDEQLLHKAMRGYARRDPRAAATWAASLTSPLVRDSALREVFETWSARDPRSAGEMVVLLPIGTAQSTAATVVSKHFARVNFEGALAWMGTLAAPAQAAAFQTIMRSQWTKTGSTNPGAALPWVLAQSSLSFREQGIRFVAGEWAKRDPLSALAHASIIAARPDRNAFLETALRTYTQTNPREAALWLASQPSSPETERLMNQVMAAWTAFEPRQTAQWATAREDPALRSKSITAVAESWAKVDAGGLVAWLGSLTDAAARDAAIDGATRVWMRNDPAKAAQWSTGIIDPGKRDHSITQIVREWKTHDMAAALAFIHSTPAIDNNLRAQLLR